jgi:3-hydroxyacyl-CoA dehydrogenase
MLTWTLSVLTRGAPDRECRQQIQDAIVLALVNQAAVVMEAGVAEKAEDVDAVWVNWDIPFVPFI